MKKLKWLLTVIIKTIVVKIPVRGQWNDSEELFNKSDKLPEYKLRWI